MLGVEVDNVMAEYVTVMVSNKKNMGQISHDLVDFIGEESAEQFVEWLAQVLPTWESSTTQSQNVTEPESNEKEVKEPSGDSSSPTDPEPPKRVVSLKGVKSSGSSNDSQRAENQKRVISLGGRKSNDKGAKGNDGKEDLRAVLKRRAERFGVVRPESPKKGSRKRKSSLENGNEGMGSGRQRDTQRNPLEKRLGPPVKSGVGPSASDEDAREHTSAHRRKKSRQQEQGRRRDNQEAQDDDARKHEKRDRRQRDPSDSNEDGNHPSGSDQDRNRSRNGRDGGPRGPPGPWNGPPPGYGGFMPHHPYGGPPMYFPPPYGPPMPPYGMGYPPHGAPPHGHGRGRHGMPYGQPGLMGPGAGPRGPRSFQNKKWVNPNVAKKDENGDTTEGSSDANASGAGAGVGTGGAQLNASAPNFAPRNPFFSSQMRPRFQNKTWVRQDPEKEATLSESLPKTPPPETEEEQHTSA